MILYSIVSSRQFGVLEPWGSFRMDTSSDNALFTLSPTLVDEARTLKVAVIGSGLAEITAGIILPSKVLNIELTIFREKSRCVRHMAGECVPRCTLRHLCLRLSIHLLFQQTVDKRFCTRTRNSRILAVSGQKL